MGYLDELRAFNSQNGPGEAPTKPTKPTCVSLVGDPQPRFHPEAGRLLREWQDGLNSLDPLRPLHGLDLRRWRTLREDAIWLAESFAAGAAKDGWSTADLFGVLVGQDRCGGIADRLAGSRSLKMTADRARWRSAVGNVTRKFNRTTYPDLVPLWQC